MEQLILHPNLCLPNPESLFGVMHRAIDLVIKQLQYYFRLQKLVKLLILRSTRQRLTLNNTQSNKNGYCG